MISSAAFGSLILAAVLPHTPMIFSHRPDAVRRYVAKFEGDDDAEALRSQQRQPDHCSVRASIRRRDAALQIVCSS